MLKKINFNLFFLFVIVVVINGEVFTGAVDMEDVIEVEDKYINCLESFVSKQENFIDFIKMYVPTYLPK